MVLFFVFYSVVISATGQSYSNKKIIDTELLRFEKMTQKDVYALEKMLSEDLVYTHSNAAMENKQQHLEAISSGRIVYKKMVRESVSLRIYGKTALTNGVVQVEGVSNGNTFTLRLQYSAVYRKKHGDWLLLNWQSTKIPDK